MFEKKADTQVAINDLLARRWSGRAFDPERPLAREQVLALLEAARWSPSCYGDEPWRFIVCDREADAEAWHAAFACLSEGNQSWAGNAPLLMLVVASEHFRSNGKPNRWGQYDTGAAAMGLCIQATAMDLMVHQMGGFDSDRARQSFAVPDGFQPMAVLAVGYQLPVDAIPGALEERERAPRRRSPLGEHFFAGSWGRALA
jgi:nitroreductase